MRFALIAVALLLPSLAFAQSFAAISGGAPQPLTLTYSPQNPRPGSTINIVPQSTLIDLANTTITILVNGKQVYSGTAQSVPITLGPSGTQTSIKATALSAGQSFSATLLLNPGDVSIVEEPLGYAPALYPGKPVPTDTESIRLVAVADLRTSPTKAIAPNNLSYTWVMDGTTLDSSSGIGKSAAVVSAPLEYRSGDVSVTVESQDGSVVGGDSITITPLQPTLRIYASDPLQGILYDHALAGTVALTGSEGSFVAEPYSLSLANGLPSVQWFLNGSAAQSGNSITLRPSGTGAGSATISATAGSDLSASLNLTFGSSSGGILGL